MQPTPLNPDCDTLWNKYSTWNDTVKQGLKNYALASMDALIYPFFWTWKVSCVLGYGLRGVHQHPLSFILIWLTIGVSASTLAPAPVLACFFHAISLTRKSLLSFFSLPFVTWFHRPLSSRFYWPLVVEWGAQVLARVTAFHASPCACPDYFPTIHWSVRLPIDPGSCERVGF